MDVALFVSSSKTGFKYMMRNSQGNFMAAKDQSFYSNIFDPAFAEAIGLKEALSCIKSLQIQPVVVELDALSVVQVLQQPAHDNS